MWKSHGGRQRRCHDAYVDQFEAEVGDPLYESVEGALIWELAKKRGCVGAHADLAVVEFRRATVSAWRRK